MTKPSLARMLFSLGLASSHMGRPAAIKGSMLYSMAFASPGSLWIRPIPREGSMARASMSMRTPRTLITNRLFICG